MKLTYGKVKVACAKVLNLNPDDERVMDYTNRGVERLLYEGKWVDTWTRYAVCTSDSCLTWPREIETIEATAFCTSPVTIRNGWYEFLEQGPGVLNNVTSCGPSLTLIDRGNAVAFDDITATGYTLAIYAEGAEDADATVLVRYYNSSGNKVRTQFNGEWIEGERIAIPDAGNYAYSTFEVLPNGLYHVEKPVTNKPIRLYGYKTSDASYKALGLYEADEELPQYRRSYIPVNLNTGSTTCSTTPVTIAAKLRFIPAINDNSVLSISHADAIRLAVQAVKKEEDNLFDEAVKYWGLAKLCLDRQLNHWMGAGEAAPMRIMSDNTYGGGVINLV